MSQLTHPKPQLTADARSHRRVVLAALLALAATVAVLLVLAIADNQSMSSVGDRGVRTDGGPEESAVAAAVGSQPTLVRPDESTVAATIGSTREPAPAPVRPDESAVATAIAGR